MARNLETDTLEGIPVTAVFSRSVTSARQNHYTGASIV